jgi:hypothetical protein
MGNDSRMGSGMKPRADVDQVRIFIGASAAYAAIKGQDFSMDVRLTGGRSAAASLRESAAELRARAADFARRADRIESAAIILEVKR